MNNRLYRGAQVLFILLLLSFICSCSDPETQLETIAKQDEIRVVTVYGPTTYFIDTDSETGFEYEMARLFAEQLNTNLKIIIASNKSEMIDVLMRGEADVAVGLIKQTFGENDHFRFIGSDYNFKIGI